MCLHSMFYVTSNGYGQLHAYGPVVHVKDNDFTQILY